MAEQTDQEPQQGEAEPQQPEEASLKKSGFFRSLFTTNKKWLAILVGAAIALQGVGLACYKLGRAHCNVNPSAEIDLGQYCFVAYGAEDGPIGGAKFQLHIALLEQVDRAARKRLNQRQYRVRQDVEQLLRRAHGGDFDDPDLGELKRQLQEQINETLGMRAIADVVITDLKLQDSGRRRNRVSDTAESVPWAEKSDGGKLKTES